MRRGTTISRRLGRFRVERRLILLMIAAIGAFAAWRFLAENPQHNPWTPLDLRDPVGWATQTKLSAMRDDPALCRDILSRSDIKFDSLPPTAPDTGQQACARSDRTVLQSVDFTTSNPAMTCPVAAGLTLWMEQAVQPRAREILGQEVTRISHLGTYNCRRQYGSDSAPWSEHATGNAIDIAGFELADGSTISLMDDWEGDGSKALFLRAIRDEACPIFGTVLSPDYNAAHRDHFHLDQAARAWRACN